MGNQIDYCFMNTTGNDQYVQSGDLKCWWPGAARAASAAPSSPDTPTLEEIYPDENMPRLDMYGYIAGPAGMSDELVQTINDAIKEAVETDTVKEGYKKLATTSSGSLPQTLLRSCSSARTPTTRLTL